MKRRKGWLGLCYAVIIVFGGYFLLAQWMTDRRIRAALPMEAQQILDRSQQFILYSLHPRPMELDAQELKTRPSFHGYMVLGQTEVTSTKTQADLLAALYAGLGKGDPATCFNPRHGIRAVRNNKTVDLVICFECQQIDIYDEHEERTATVTSAAQSLFNRVLSEAKIPLAGP